MQPVQCNGVVPILSHEDRNYVQQKIQDCTVVEILSEGLHILGSCVAFLIVIRTDKIDDRSRAAIKRSRCS